ncbi:MAG TPA: ATP-dependent helicase C-terminal domain-containing protein, partial [Pseudomonadales bacterium]|nr:ATP-dependent helicase C-terminal domain-containing protein [Pseudomonadales bacterium]
CKQLAQRINTAWNAPTSTDCAPQLIHAFPDRIAQRRADSKTRYLMANGRGVQLHKYDSLAGSDYLVILDADGATTEPQVRLAYPIKIEDIRSTLSHHIQETQSVHWNPQRNAVEAASSAVLGALTLNKTLLPQPWPEAATHCLLDAIKTQGLAVLPWQEDSIQLRARVNWLHLHDKQWPNWSDENLLADLSVWLAPFLIGIYSFSALQSIDLYQALLSKLDWGLQQSLDRLAPADWTVETGIKTPLDYLPENGPVLRCKMQALYGLTQHPSLPNGQKILIELISPAGRPIQVTRDLPGFWQGSYAEVAKEMRGRYPKHYWPDNPMQAVATTKTKKYM